MSHLHFGRAFRAHGSRDFRCGPEGSCRFITGQPDAGAATGARKCSARGHARALDPPRCVMFLAAATRSPPGLPCAPEGRRCRSGRRSRSRGVGLPGVGRASSCPGRPRPTGRGSPRPSRFCRKSVGRCCAGSMTTSPSFRPPFWRVRTGMPKRWPRWNPSGGSSRCRPSLAGLHCWPPNPT